MAYCEDILDTYVKHLHDALRAEPPDARTTRLADQARRHRDYHPMTLRLLKTMETDDPIAPPADPHPAPVAPVSTAAHELVNGTVIASATVVPPGRRSAHRAGGPRPARVPRPAHRARGSPGARAPSCQSVDPDARPHRPPPGMAVPYDGSDDMDDEPGWVKII